ncbi:unnamed protein product [Sphagnum tenellum]
MPTVSTEQAKQLAQLVLDHGNRLRAILGIRPHDAPIPLAGIKLNRADQQMIIDILAQKNPDRVSEVDHRAGQAREDFYRECNPFDRRAFENTQEEEAFQEHGSIPPVRGAEYQTFLYEVARKCGRILPGDSWHLYFDRGLSPDQAIEAHRKTFPSL